MDNNKRTLLLSRIVFSVCAGIIIGAGVCKNLLKKGWILEVRMGQ